MVRTKPEWFTIRPPKGEFHNITSIVKSHNLHTVCEEAHCPNMSECWSGGTATFMVLGDTCTRACKFCAIKTSPNPNPPDPHEPENLANALSKISKALKYIVLTSVDRDDLSDQGANHIALCIKSIKQKNPEMLVEVLIPDFRGEEKLIQTIIDSKPDVIAHNIETIERLQKQVRDLRAGYEQSLFVLNYVKEKAPHIITKSSIMLGLGETEDEVRETMLDLRKNNVDVVTLGQYLKPQNKYLKIFEYVHPNVFKRYEGYAKEAGFLYCASGPLVRSSYKAGEFFIKNVLNGRNSLENKKIIQDQLNGVRNRSEFKIVIPA